MMAIYEVKCDCRNPERFPFWNRFGVLVKGTHLHGFGTSCVLRTRYSPRRHCTVSVVFVLYAVAFITVGVGPVANCLLAAGCLPFPHSFPFLQLLSDVCLRAVFVCVCALFRVCLVRVVTCGSLVCARSLFIYSILPRSMLSIAIRTSHGVLWCCNITILHRVLHCTNSQ